MTLSKQLSRNLITAMLLAVTVVASAAQSLAPSMPATEYIRGRGRVIATLKGSDHIFTDVSLTANYFGPAHIMVDRGITAGCGTTTFCPDGAVTRGSTAVFIVRSLYVSLGGSSLPYDGNSNPSGWFYPTTPYFTDVPPTHIFFPYIQKMKELGITAGCTATEYCPDLSIKNGEIAVFTIRAWQLRTSSTTPGQPGPYPASDDFAYSGTPYFTDVSANHMFFKFIQKVRDMKIITTGCTSTAFCPDTIIPRGPGTFYYVRGILGDYMY